MCAPSASQRDRERPVGHAGAGGEPTPELEQRDALHRPLRRERHLEGTQQRALLELGRETVEQVGRAQHRRRSAE